MRVGVCLAAVAALSAMTSAAQAQQEPFGQPFDGWKFTQAPNATGVICRAFAPGQGLNIIGRTGDGAFYVSTDSKVPKGTYEGASIVIAGETEMVTASSDGPRYVTPVDEDQLKRIVRNAGYSWRVMFKGKLSEGYVSFDGDVGKAVKRLRECTKANVGR